MEIGLRVVRGPDWMWGDQDGGEGNVGTVVQLGGNNGIPDETVLVCWDSGKQADYRAGYSGKYDLRVFDNAQTGVKHSSFICDGCEENPLIGTRWNCADCFDYDLCSACFVNDVHDKRHKFLRFDQPGGNGILVGKRSNFVKLQSKGFFPGARVARGRDWKWRDQDGGSGRVGMLSEVTAWSEWQRSGAKVIWNLLRSNTYRTGYQGMVDLKCVTPANGPSYYRDCLAKVGEMRQLAQEGAYRLRVGDRVSVCLDVEDLKPMAQGHGSWIDDVGECIGKVGMIRKIDSDGYVHISYCLKSWVFHSDDVKKLQAGDKVRVLSGKQVVQNLQQGHGGWNESMTEALGKQGKILDVYRDGDVRVMVGTKLWRFNPAALATVCRGETSQSGAAPSEILARGPLAFEAYSKALAEGRTCDKRVPIMLIGQDRSGKTSLKNSFLGKPFNSDEDSTVGIDIDPSHFKVSTEVWKVGERNQETNSGTSISYEHQAARLTVQNLFKEESTSKEGDPDDSTERDVNDSITASPTSFVANVATFNDHELSEITNDFRSVETSHFEISSDANFSPDNVTGMPDNIASLIEVLLREGDEVDDKEDLYSVLWDFGGQAVYYATHPLFLTPRAIYLLVYDLSRDPRGRAKSVMRQGMFTKFEDSFDFRSNFDYLEFWMSSVSSLAIEDESDHQVPRSTLLPEKLPPVFLVCTHADVPYGGVDSTTLANEVFGSLQTKPYETHLYHNVFVVDNTKSGSEFECPEVRRLRKEVLDVAKELPQMKEAIPIKWLRYEKELQVMKDDGHKYIPLERAKLVASEVCNIVDDEQFLTLLNFLHDQRILIHFADTPELNRLVVLDPQWLIDVFKEVITIRPYQGKEKEFKKLWFKLEKEGILEEKLLDHVWGPLFDNKETPESLIAIMEKFSLLCPLLSSDELCSKQYLVPSMLMSHPPEDIAELIKSAHIPSLFVKFESSHILRGLFPRLVLQFFQWAKEESMIPVNPQLYHNFASFYISEDENCSVVLLCHSFSIEVVVHKGNSSHGQIAGIPQSKLSLPTDASCDTCARAVRRQLGLILESMPKEFCWLNNLKYEVSFLCPVCCQGSSVNYCRTHRTKGCEQEECLHFWSESQVCDVKTLSCSKSAVAQNKRFETKQFTPWLLPQRNQLIAAKHDGRNLDEAKEIALLDEAQNSLLSQSCDAKEVVLQLQMKQASLEQPDCETKALIRCLARKSKDSDRRDVFQHLREITPAGTTGPLLPEHLDVRNIPSSKGREVTINLCGGEEWKMVAEALGMTPAEIRFLDNRTLNPLDAALAFISKQRCITVGDLYDVLIECGCPVIADLL